MVGFYKHDIPDWMDGTEALSDGAYRAYHVICQLIYLHEGPIMLNERGIAGRCNQSVKAFRKYLQELLDAGKLAVSEGRLSNSRAALELENVRKNRENAGKGGQISGQKRQNSQKNDIGADKSLKNNGADQAPLQEDRSLKEKRREEEKDTRTGMRMPENMQARMLAELPPGVDWPIRISMDLRPIFACLEAGADFEKHILPTIHEEARLAHAGGRKLFKWENVAPQIMAAVEREKRPTDRKDQNGFTDEAWSQIIERWKRTGLWSYGKWSLPPDFPGCSIPAHVLAAHGFGKAAA